MKSLFKNRTSFVITYVSSIIWLIVAHGMAIFNKYSFHDDIICFNSVGSTFGIGRWMLGIIHKIVVIFLGESHYSMPLIDGVLTALCIATIVYIFVNVFDIKSKVLIILTMGIMISFPAITGTFGYIFTAPYYYIGALTGVYGAYLFHEKKNFVSAIMCTILMACSAGIYQANMSISICSLLLFLLHDVYCNRYSWKQYIKNIIANIAICLAFLVEYLLANQFFLWKLNLTLVSYKGIDNYGRTGLGGYIQRIISAYREFFFPTQAFAGNMYPFNATYFHILLIVVMVIFLSVFFIRFFKEDKSKVLQMLLIVLVYPLAAYFIYVMVEFWDVHSLMVYGEAFTFMLTMWILDKLADTKLETKLKKIALVLVGIILYFNIRLSNICYLKAEIMQSQAISYYTTLITTIKNTEGYTEGTPVLWINERKKNDSDFIGTEKLFDEIAIFPYYGTSIINDYAWRQTMAFWCGYDPVMADPVVWSNNVQEVYNMPCYPDKGSIKCIDGKIIVKFAENE